MIKFSKFFYWNTQLVFTHSDPTYIKCVATLRDLVKYYCQLLYANNIHKKLDGALWCAKRWSFMGETHLKFFLPLSVSVKEF